MKFIKYTIVILLLLCVKLTDAFSQHNKQFKLSYGLNYVYQNNLSHKNSLSFTKEPQSNNNYLVLVSNHSRGKQKKITGIIFTAIGCGLLATGIGLVASADSYSYQYSTGPYGSSSSGDLKGALGIIAIPGSLGFLIPGIVKWNKGAKQMKIDANGNVIPQEDNSIKPTNKLWHLTIGSAIPLKNKFSSVFGSGLSLNTGFNIGLFKNTIKVGPAFGLDYFSNDNYEKLTQIMAGASVGYLLKLNDRKTTYLYPGISLYYASYKDRADLLKMEDPILRGKGAALELKANIIFKKYILGISYLNYNPKSSYSTELVDKMQQNNALYPITIVTNKSTKFDLSTFKLSMGIIF